MGKTGVNLLISVYSSYNDNKRQVYDGNLVTWYK